MEPREVCAALEAQYKGCTVLFGTTHFELVSVVPRLVDRGRSVVLVAIVTPERVETTRAGLDPVHSFRGFPVAWDHSY